MQNQTLIKLSNNLMDDLDKIRAEEMKPRTALLICKHANTVMRAENAILQYHRIAERIKRRQITHKP